MLSKFRIFFALSGIVCSCFASDTPALKIVCFGDSLTSCGGEGGRYSDMLQISLPQHKLINSGISGDTIGADTILPALRKILNNERKSRPGCLTDTSGSLRYRS